MTDIFHDIYFLFHSSVPYRKISKYDIDSLVFLLLYFRI